MLIRSRGFRPASTSAKTATQVTGPPVVCLPVIDAQHALQHICHSSQLSTEGAELAGPQFCTGGQSWQCRGVHWPALLGVSLSGEVYTRWQWQARATFWQGEVQADMGQGLPRHL